MHAAYCELHARGHAHSVEVRLDGALVGGLYGVLIGRVFFGESMFSRERDASKVALARLVGTCALWRDSNSSIASYLHLICAPWAASRCPVSNSARW